MTNIDRSQFYSGGFFLIRAVETPQGLDDSNLLPEKIISLSSCFCKKLDNTWTWTADKTEEAFEFGISESKWDMFKSWCSTQYQAEQLDMYGMFNSKQIVQDCVQQFISDKTNLHLIEVGLPHYLGADNWREQIPDDGHDVGIEQRISRCIPMLKDGLTLGFEVVSYCYHDFGHTWLCSYLHREMHELYGIKPNQYGFIDTFDDAKKVYDWIAEDDMRGRRGEPEPYDFWLVVSHPLEEEKGNPPTDQ
jgi:hypothetical protein